MSKDLERANRLLEFETAQDNRKFEIQMFWQRANYFLVLNTALAIGIFTVNSDSVAIFIALFGMIASYLWFSTNLGARYWQVFWEEEVSKLSKNFGISAFEISDDEIQAKAKRNLRLSGSHLRKWVDRQVTKKPSVSYNMILLSLVTIVTWTLLFSTMLIKEIIQFCSCM